ncbi:MAG TPA: UvrD-helicase domain-containing protein [Candidatus Kapabacteria bacterium]
MPCIGEKRIDVQAWHNKFTDWHVLRWHEAWNTYEAIIVPQAFHATFLFNDAELSMHGVSCAMMQLTPAQEQALSWDRHLAITANAGSGKTRVLVRRYVDLFLSIPNLTTRNVAAITFTENAAAELRERIADEVKERLANAELDGLSKDRLRHLRDSLRSAFVGTIHSFAARILKEYPVEANVDASFAIVTGADRMLLEEDAIETTFYSALEDAYLLPNENANLHLFRTLGRVPITKLVRTLLRNRQRTERIQNVLLAQSDEAILEFWQKALYRSLPIVTDLETHRVLREVQQFATLKSDGAAFSLAFIAYNRTNDFFEAASALSSVLDRLLSKNLIRARVIDLNSLPTDVAENIEQWLEQARTARPILSTITASESDFRSQHIEYLTLVRTIFDLYDQIVVEYNSRKLENGLLDFDDLIERLLRLLDDTQVRTDIAAELRFLMIDEYQDTDERQFELAKILTAQFAHDSNLAIVGDPKQSIYSFRNADVEVFDTTRGAIETHGHIELGESFRMTRAPLVAINRLFRDLLHTDSSTYSELIHARDGKCHGSVAWIAPFKNSKEQQTTEEEEVEDVDESALIAQKIWNIKQNVDGQYSFETKEGLREPDFGDIAILLRSRTSLSLLERALAERSIPYSIAKGSGFFIQQEVQDILSYLTFLISPGDEIALAGILRSPFFALSDMELFQIAHHGSLFRQTTKQLNTFWQKFQSYVHAQKHPHLDRILSQLTENLTLAARTTTAFLIEKIFSETGIYASLQSASQAAQKVANLEKFLALARTSDQSGFSNIFDFVERACWLRDSGQQESQADVPADTGVVRIMTVHAAKGLEFPIVILPFLQKKFNFTHRELLDKELGLQLSFPEGYPEPAIAELIHQRICTATVEEEKRILYVAMTRAKDHLVLSCTMPKEPQSNTWLKWIVDSIGFPEGSHISLTESLTRYNGTTRERFSEPFQLDIPILRSIEDIPLLAEETSGSIVPFPAALYLSPISITASPNRFSASQLLRFRECPTKYYLAYNLGMPEEPKLIFDVEPEVEAEHVRGPLLGQVVHAMMQRMERWYANGALNPERFQADMQSTLDSLDVANDAARTELSRTAFEHLERFLHSSIAIELLAAQRSRSEYILQTVLPTGDTLFGILDRLYQDKDGNWTVLDFKTDSVPHPDKYEFQLRFYAYLVHRMLKATEVRGVLFFTASGTITAFHFSDFSSIGMEIESRIQEIKAMEAIRDLSFLPRNERHCPDCRYFNSTAGQCIVLEAQNPTATPAM